MKIYFSVQVRLYVFECAKFLSSSFKQNCLCQWIHFLVFLEHGVLPQEEINYFRVKEQVSQRELK